MEIVSKWDRGPNISLKNRYRLWTWLEHRDPEPKHSCSSGFQGTQVVQAKQTHTTPGQTCGQAWGSSQRFDCWLPLEPNNDICTYESILRNVSNTCTEIQASDPAAQCCHHAQGVVSLLGPSSHMHLPALRWSLPTFAFLRKMLRCGMFLKTAFLGHFSTLINKVYRFKILSFHSISINFWISILYIPCSKPVNTWKLF